MEISRRTIKILEAAIAAKCEGEEHLNTTIEVIDNNISYFIDITYRDTATRYDSGTNSHSGRIELDIEDITVFDADADPLERENIEEVKKQLTDRVHY